MFTHPYFKGMIILTDKVNKEGVHMSAFAISDTLAGKDIKALRQTLGMTQEAFSRLVCVSKKTIERWESSEKEITGPIVTLAKILTEYLQIKEELEIPEKEYPLRLWYMCGNKIYTIIDVDERHRRVKIYNYTRNFLSRAFGREEHPTFEAYEAFLESRCFPRSRDKMKLILRELDNRQSSKGNQLKWESGGIWYKADYTGCEGLAEYVVSGLLLESSLLPEEFVSYQTEEISYKQNRYLANRCIVSQ